MADDGVWRRGVEDGHRCGYGSHHARRGVDGRRKVEDCEFGDSQAYRDAVAVEGIGPGAYLVTVGEAISVGSAMPLPWGHSPTATSPRCSRSPPWCWMRTLAIITPCIWRASALYTSLPSCGVMRRCISRTPAPMPGEVLIARMAVRMMHQLEDLEFRR